MATDDRVDYRRLGELGEEFDALWHRLHGFYLDSVTGFTYMRQAVEKGQQRAREFVKGTECDNETFQDSCQFSYSDIFTQEFCASGIHKVTQGEIKRRNGPDGANFTTLGQLCIVAFYDFWQDYLRREIVVAKGFLSKDEKNKKIIDECCNKHASHDLWGDIRHLRNSIVHTGGVATSDVARCKLINWFEPGDRIALTPQHMYGLFMALLSFRNALFKERFPPRTLIIGR